MKIYVPIFLCYFFLSSCFDEADPVATEQNAPKKAEYSQNVKNYITKVIENGLNISTLLENGANIEELKEAAKQYNSSLKILLNFLPEDFDKDVIQNLQNAQLSWSYTILLWEDQIYALKPDSYRHKHFSKYKQWHINNPRAADGWDPAPPQLWLDRIIWLEHGDKDKSIMFTTIKNTLGVGGQYFEMAKPTLLKIVR
jgi:hypothetical protein